MKNNFDEMYDLIEESSHNKKIKKKNLLAKPEWLIYNKNDKLNEIYKNEDNFWKNPKIAFGCPVQANERLYSIGTSENCPANFIYTYDEYYINNPRLFYVLSTEIFELWKIYDDLSDDKKYISDLLTSETERFFRVEIPDDMTYGRKVFLTTLIVDRDHIPYHSIINFFYPLLISEEGIADAMILPVWYWSGLFTDVFNFGYDGRIRSITPEETCFTVKDMFTFGTGKAFSKEHPIAHIMLTLCKILAFIEPLYILFYLCRKYSMTGIGFISGFFGCSFLSVGLVSFIGSFMEQYLGDKITKDLFRISSFFLIICILITIIENIFNLL